MNRRRSRPSSLAAGAALALAALAAPLLTLPLSVANPAAATGVRRASDVQVKVVDVSPSAPLPSHQKRRLTITLELTNTTTTPLRNVVVTGARGDPVENQRALDAVLGDDTQPASVVPITTAAPVRVDLPADGTAHRVVFATDTDIPTDAGICLCSNAVYPLYFSARSAGGNGHRLGSAATYLPSFYATPEPVRVSWVWPLIDRPHRLTDDSVFSDDTLSTTVGPDGRLDRALAVVEQVDDTVPLTLVVDPELLDELAVMATGKYTVDTGVPGTKPLTGTGALAASDWLQRFRSVLDSHPNVQVRLTPYADPDVQSLSLQELGWQTTMPAAMVARVTAALAGRPLDFSLAWPAGGAVTAKVLRSLVDRGVRSAILPAAAMTPRDGAGGTVPAGMARLTSSGHSVAVAATAAAAQKYAGRVVSGDVGQLPGLMAEIAIRAAQDAATEHTLVLTPARYVNPNVAAAARAIDDTSRSPFAAPIALDRALAAGRLPPTRSKLAAFPSSAPTLPAQTIRAAADVTGTLPAIRSLLSKGGKDAAALIAAVPIGLQRTESSYWLTHPALAATFSDPLVKQVDALTSSVSIVPPRSGYYTLGSSNSPLPVTVQNTLRYPVQVRLKVSTVNGLPGFTARDIGPQLIDANARRTLHLSTSIARSGRIQIEAQLLTPRKQAIGGPVSLSVHSTAFGAIGVIITIAAGAVLLLALVVRAGRRLRGRRRKQPARPAGSRWPAAAGEVRGRAT